MTKLLSALFCAAFFALPCALPQTAKANERTVLQDRASQPGRNLARALFGTRPRKQLRPVERIQLSTNVYRYQGRASIRHDEASSPEIIFHFRNGRLRPGHAFDR